MAGFITREGMQRLKKRMNVLIEERAKVIKQVVQAREMGDLSENAEYHAARERQHSIESEYENIKKKINHLQVIDTDSIPKDAVRFGACVTLMDQNQNREVKIKLVGGDEVFDSEDEYKRMSVTSPIGKGLIGKKAGETVIINTPDGERTFKIIDIR